MNIRQLDGKRILILGFGREGVSTLDFIFKHCNPMSVAVADRKENIVCDNGIELILGPDYIEHIDKFDIIIKSPGVKLTDKVNITSQADLFTDKFFDKIIGVTGTKGKSTTSALIYHLHNPEDTLMLGNMGIPALDKYDNAFDVKNIVFEYSSHQLLNVRKSPHIAVLLNFYQEHLDYYDTYEEYTRAKCNIFRFQNESDFLVYNADDRYLTERINEFNPLSVRYKFSLKSHNENGCCIEEGKLIYIDNGSREIILDDLSNISLKGEHNLYNVMAAVIVSKISKIESDTISDKLSSFCPLPHRLEFVGNVGGVDFYNDSIATIAEATQNAVKALKNVDTLILGGFDRGIDYMGLVEFLPDSGINNIIFTGDAGKRMLYLLGQLTGISINVFYCDNYEEIVNIAKRITRSGHVCLLSPAASSYDAFKNFEERGDYFKKLVLD